MNHMAVWESAKQGGNGFPHEAGQEERLRNLRRAYKS